MLWQRSGRGICLIPFSVRLMPGPMVHSWAPESSFATTFTQSLFMLFSTVLMWLLIAVAFLVALPALWLLTRGLWPEHAVRLRQAAERGLLKSFFLGLAPLVLGVLLVAALAKLPKAGVLAALTGGLLITWGWMGAAGWAALLGERLWPQAEPWRQLQRGGWTLVCCALLPVVGWFVLLPLMAVMGAGTQLRARFGSPPAAASVDSAVSPPNAS